MNPEYLDFVAIRPRPFIENEDLPQIFHDRDIELYKKIYEDNYKRKDVKMISQADCMTLRLGFIIDDGKSKEWHTVKLGAFKAHLSSYRKHVKEKKE